MAFDAMPGSGSKPARALVVQTMIRRADAPARAIRGP